MPRRIACGNQDKDDDSHNYHVHIHQTHRDGRAYDVLDGDEEGKPDQNRLPEWRNTPADFFQKIVTANKGQEEQDKERQELDWHQASHPERIQPFHGGRASDGFSERQSYCTLDTIEVPEE